MGLVHGMARGQAQEKRMASLTLPKKCGFHQSSFLYMISCTMHRFKMYRNFAILHPSQEKNADGAFVPFL